MMSVLPVAAGPETVGPDSPLATVDLAAAESEPHAGVRVVSLAVLLLAVLAFGALIFQFASTAVTVTDSDSPQVAGALIAGVIALMALAVLLFRPERGDLGALISTSAAWSIALLMALVLAWAGIASADRQDEWHGTPVFSAADVNAYLKAHVPPGVTAIRIPTGVLIKSMEFLSGDNVQVTGFIWQQYGPDVPADLDRGVVLAEAVKEAYDAKQVYQYEKDGVQTIGWYFAATLRQPFEYAEYPFDEQDVWLRLWAKDFGKSTVLVPDFSSYTSLDPKAMPGLEKEFVYSGWSPVYSGFSLSNQPYSTSYGIGAAKDYNYLPELYFNLILDRNFAGPFFEQFIFALAASILLFGLIVLTTDDENLKSRFQLSTAGVLGAASGLLFAVILKHNQLRTQIGSRGVSYVEIIPIILYAVIVVVVLNAILLASPRPVKLIHYRHNLIPVLAYWPTVLGLLLAATLFVFFRA
jgi:hypothetical protein